MKSFHWLLIVLVVLLAACQADATPTPTVEIPAEPTQVISPPTATPTEEVYPAPPVVTPTAVDESYPAPPTLQPTQPAYPEPGETITWEQAQELITSGQVSEVVQAHSLNVTLTLADGRILQTVEPEIDAILQVIEQCGDPCAAIVIGTE